MGRHPEDRIDALEDAPDVFVHEHPCRVCALRHTGQVGSDNVLTDA